MSVVLTERDFFPLFDIDEDPFEDGDYYTIYSRSGDVLIYGKKEQGSHLYVRGGFSYKSWDEVSKYLTDLPLQLICERFDGRCDPSLLYSLAWIWLEEARITKIELSPVDMIPKPEIDVITQGSRAMVTINGTSIPPHTLSCAEAVLMAKFISLGLGITTETPERQGGDNETV